nr:phage major capsid protein [uncultured Cetobacterium sp.]
MPTQEKPTIPLENLTFGMDITEFKESENQDGTFEGVLVNYNHNNLARGYYKFLPGSMKGNEGKTLLLLYNHCGNNIPVGTLQGKETKEGFIITAKFQLTKDGDSYLNKDAAALYDLLKNQGAKLQLSAGGTIADGEFKQEIKNGKTIYYYEIKKFDAYEGSITPKAAVQGSTINKIFSQGEEGMDKNELVQLFSQAFNKFSKEMLEAQSTKEIQALPEKFSELETQFSNLKESLTEELKEEFSQKFIEVNDVIKGLKLGFTATSEQEDRAVEFLAAIEPLKDGKATTFKIEESTIFSATTGTTTGEGTKAAVRAQYFPRIIKRLQERNTLFSELTIIPISDNSLQIDREEIGLPETAWVGEEDVRSETDISKLKDVDIKVNQIYSMPKLSNKLIATNYVGYVDFLLSRVEYALSLKLANTILNGTGTKQPLGILNDSNVTNAVSWAAAITDEQLGDSILDTFNGVKDEIAASSSWIMPRSLWVRIAKIKDTDGRYKITDIKTGGKRELMARPVKIIDSPNSGLNDFATATAGQPIAVFGDIKNGMLGIENTALNISIMDKVTSKGFTKYYIEKGLGFGVVLPEYFTIIKKQ